MIGYKGFKQDLTCRDYQFKENETFEISGPIEICKSGFHFCDVPINVLSYYNNYTDKYAIIEALGEIQAKRDKLATNKIRIIKVINRQELEIECGNNSYYTLSGEYHFKNGKLHRENDLPARICENGSLEWYINGLLHRENDLPAIKNINGDQFWYKNDQLHRDNDLPAKIFSNGNMEWYNLGKLHRENIKPNVKSSNGDQFWYKHGKLHRENDLPAKIYITGSQFWYKNGQLHRENDLPAIINSNGDQYWYINGETIKVVYKNN